MRRVESLFDVKPTKFCCKCRITKMASSFARHCRTTDGLQNVCKSCAAAYARNRGKETGHAAGKKLARSVKGRYRHLTFIAKRRKIELTITLEEYTALTASPCFYCHGPLNVTGGGLDRADNGLGYVTGNCVPCCRTCNMVKGATFTAHEMVEIGAVISRIYERRRCH